MHPDTQTILGGDASLDGLAPNAPVGAGSRPEACWTPWVSVGLALATAVFGLSNGALPRRITELFETVFGWLLDLLQALHSGQVGDYIAWATLGLGLFAFAFAWK